MVLSRIFASLGKGINVGFFLPDYTSYEGIMSVFNNCEYTPIYLDENDGFEIDIDKLDSIIKDKSIEVLLISNPSNPTGNVISGERLEQLINITQANDVLLILDEFYLNYIYQDDNKLVSAAKYVETIESSNVIIVGGLTKPWRYPGWRIAWALGAKKLISKFSTIGSFLDGGANHPLQEAALSLVNPKNLLKETEAIQNEYIKKRNFAIEGLTQCGLEIVNNPEGAFYIWAKIDSLPSLINDGMSFFEECLKEKVIVVPGQFFDINPNKAISEKRFGDFVRISYSADFDTVKEGIQRIGIVVKKYKTS